MSSSVTDPSLTENGANAQNANASPSNKGKAKAHVTDEPMDDAEEEEEEEDDDEEEMNEEEDEEDAETYEEIDPSAIITAGRRTRGVRVDYTSKEALAKAGLKEQDLQEDEDEDMDA